MAFEVSFFHAIRITSIEEQLEEKELILKLIEMSEDNWDNGPDEVRICDLRYKITNEVEKLRGELEEAKRDLEEAKRDRR